MTEEDRKGLDLASFGLDEFQPRTARGKGRAPVERKAVEAASSWKSREPQEIAQLGIRGDKAVVERYKAMCEAHGRRTYIEMLEMLMDAYEGRR